MIKILTEEYINNNKVLLISLVDTITNETKSFGVTGKALKKYIKYNKPVNGLWALNKEYYIIA